MKFYFYIGLLIIVVSETLLFAGVKWAGIFFTPLVWTGYILFIDAIVYRIKGESWITGRSKVFLLMVLLSAVFWYVFEFFNLFLKNWRYEGLPAAWITAIGMTWAFATIGPGMFETSDLLKAIGAFKLKTRKFKTSKSVLYTLVIIGAGCLISILIAPPKTASYLAIPLWVGFILLLDPLNYIKGHKSIFKELQTGNGQNFLCLFVSGLICGFLWEFWNFWAITKWVYQLPYAAGPKIFEMPLLGFLGFPALALEYYAFYSFVLRWKET
ncbi:MAG: hypothetical protein SV062_06890 [Thermodesulfobacteriota bacterium]|nr:hypothetical protein [Thermodesulfobacteriota bacterium]